jgi:hypothetical protein
MVFHHVIKQKNFDSVFDPAQGSRSARLTIKLTVDLLALDPSLADSPAGGEHPVHLAHSMTNVRRGLVKDGDDDPIMCRSWLMHEWSAFKTRFKKMVEARPWLSRIGQHINTVSGWTFMHRIHFRQRYP